jgi:hypothetical protein
MLTYIHVHVEYIFLYISEDVIYDKAAFEALMAQGNFIYIFMYMHVVNIH